VDDKLLPPVSNISTQGSIQNPNLGNKDFVGTITLKVLYDFPLSLNQPVKSVNYITLEFREIK
jgi:hypothetical protein